MAVQLLLILGELVLLFFFSKNLVKNLYVLFLLLFRVRSVAVSLVTAILFPGTIIHELSHLFTAEVLGVRTGKLTLVPESIRESDLSAGRQDVQTGSVAISQTDPFRRALIGLAPLANGLVAVTGLSYFITELLNGKSLPLLPQQLNNATILILVFFYLLFAISSSMFPSRPDLKGTPALGITIGIFLLAAYFVGIRIGLTGQILALTTRLIAGLIRSLGFVVALNIIGLLGISGIIALVQKLLRKKFAR